MTDKATYIQQLHKDCGGRIVVCADKSGRIVFACDRCATRFELTLNGMVFPLQGAVVQHPLRHEEFVDAEFWDVN